MMEFDCRSHWAPQFPVGRLPKKSLPSHPGQPHISCAGLVPVMTLAAQADVGHIIVGAGLDLAVRLEIIREVFQTSGTTTVHMKDVASGPDSFLLFVGSVLDGVADHEP